MEKIFHGAKIVLSYFHYACNGSAPLMIDWTKEESARIAKLDAEEVKYMVRTQTKIRKRGMITYLSYSSHLRHSHTRSNLKSNIIDYRN